MRVARAGVLLVGLAIVAAAIALALLLRTGKSDERKIQEMVETFFDAIVEQDAANLAGVFSADCGDLTAGAEDAITEVHGGATDVSFILLGVEIRNLEEETAEVLPDGYFTIDGERIAIVTANDEFTPVVKEDGEWKIADCSLAS